MRPITNAENQLPTPSPEISEEARAGSTTATTISAQIAGKRLGIRCTAASSAAALVNSAFTHPASIPREAVSPEALEKIR
ncbi:MAG: hypothetical protein ABSD08_15565 [Xanthobacteraceae bacterium]|jgi:hypothetical protein